MTHSTTIPFFLFMNKVFHAFFNARQTRSLSNKDACETKLIVSRPVKSDDVWNGDGRLRRRHRSSNVCATHLSGNQSYSRDLVCGYSGVIYQLSPTGLDSSNLKAAGRVYK